jgi:hypothetical protein
VAPTASTPGDVSAGATNSSSFTVTAVSKSNTIFTISRTNGGSYVRGCSPANTGGCGASSW